MEHEKVVDAQIVPSHPIQTLEEQTVELALKRAEDHIRKRKGLVKLIAKNIDPRDVVIYGKPPKETVHFAKNACKLILGWVDADIEDVSIAEHKYTSKSGPYLLFEATGTLVLGGRRRINVTGSRATYDDFFGSVGEWIDGKKVTVDRPLEEVDIPSVRLAAITNLWNHALEDAGLKPSLEELKEAGLDLNKASYVNFREKQAPEGAQSGQAQDTKQAESTPTTAPNGANEPKGEKISEAQAKRLYAIAKNLGFNTEEYRGILHASFGVTSDRDLPKSVYQLAEKYFTDNRKN